jgi:hypothetical protein
VVLRHITDDFAMVRPLLEREARDLCAQVTVEAIRSGLFENRCCSLTSSVLHNEASEAESTSLPHRQKGALAGRRSARRGLNGGGRSPREIPAQPETRPSASRERKPWVERRRASTDQKGSGVNLPRSVVLIQLPSRYSCETIRLKSWRA